LNDNTVTVIKTGKITNIAENDLCEGDILLLQPGDLVPADLKLLEARGLELDEFDLTGELKPVNKNVNGEEVFVYRGSRVTRGNGKGVVIATGEETEYGEILRQIYGQVKYKFPSLLKGKYFVLLVFLLPPLIVSLSRYSSLSFVCIIYLTMAVFVFLTQNNELFKYVFTSSEVKKIKSQNIQVYDETSLDCINNLNIVCFDKTGVLTTRDLEVKCVHFADEISDINSFVSDKYIYNLTKTACALCNDVVFFEKLNLADSIDRALIAFAGKNGININELMAKSKRIYEKPFDSEDRYMACGFELEEKKIYFVKGDPEVIIKMCQNYITVSGIEKKMELEFEWSINAKTYTINRGGDVTLALAYNSSLSETVPLYYTFLCLLQLENPVKPGVPDVVKTLKEGGIRPLILTGDRPETALKISGEIGIENKAGYCLSGKSMAQTNLSEVARQSDYVSVFARLLPSQKGVLIMLLQERNNVVAMVGDGANDTLALKVADVGISFVENSSPLAKRVSKILINELADLLTLIQSAKRIRWRVKYLMLFRGMILLSMFLILYMWMLI
jgi:Ca2+-transporting ATPase